MKRLNSIVCACAFLLIVGAYVPAYALEPGEACNKAIPMGKDYRAEVHAGDVVWYSAWTFDLPLTVTFAPAKGKGEPAPLVEMDFTCIPGYYTDSILCSLFCKTSGSSGLQMDMPHKPKLESKTMDDGTFVYYLSLGKRYRDLLLQMGISYNLAVYVKVTYQCDGTISLVPDDLFTNCMDNAKFMHLGDTVNVAALDAKRHVIVPYLQWQEDTIYYKWKGSSVCNFSVSNVCDFNPDLSVADDARMDAAPINPGDSLKVGAELIYQYVHDQVNFPNEAGMYFAKFYSEEPGIMQVVKAPKAKPEKDATILRFDMTYPLDANSTAVYAIPRSWNVDVRFLASTSHLFSMTFSKSADFAEENILKTFAFEKSETGRWTGILAADMKSFWNKIPQDKSYIYIRFTCSESTTITPERWSVSECYSKSLIEPDMTMSITRTSSTVYRLQYAQWVGGDMTISFSLSANCDVYLADTCAMNRSKPEADYWLKYKAPTKSNAPLVITADEIASWADRLDDEGSIYALFYTQATNTNRTLTFTSAAPIDSDPVYPASTLRVVCEDDKISVSSAIEQHIEIYDISSTKVDEWDAVPGDSHELNLESGAYTLVGEKEKIAINL